MFPKKLFDRRLCGKESQNQKLQLLQNVKSKIWNAVAKKKFR